MKNNATEITVVGSTEHAGETGNSAVMGIYDKKDNGNSSKDTSIILSNAQVNY